MNKRRETKIIRAAVSLLNARINAEIELACLPLIFSSKRNGVPQFKENDAVRISDLIDEAVDAQMDLKAAETRARYEGSIDIRSLNEKTEKILAALVLAIEQAGSRVHYVDPPALRPGH